MFGDFSEIWKLQRKIAFGAIRLVFDNISTCGYVSHTLIRLNGPHTTPTGFDRLSGMGGIVACVSSPLVLSSISAGVNNNVYH